MLAYASNRRVIGKRESSPNAFLLVISVHVALIAAVMSAKNDLPRTLWPSAPLIKVPVPPLPPPPNHSQPRPHPQPRNSWIDHPERQLPIATPDPQPQVDRGGTMADPGPLVGDGSGLTPTPRWPLTTTPIRHEPLLLTPPSELKPPYPPAKLAAEQEATLRLRLTIDDRGRVMSVEPVGYADREFLESARRYIIGHWRYDPASEDGHAIASTITVTLRFQLDG